MIKLFACLIVLFPVTCFSQYTITGKVVNLTDNKAVAVASVFLSNATVGTKTADNGTFTLNNVRPGQYDLVVSIIGFETMHQTVMVSGDITLPNIKILPKSILLNEVKIRPNNNWNNDYQTFKRLFFGLSPDAEKCKIVNPNLLSFDYDPETRVFSASASDFLEIENDALGYKLRYLLSDFKNDANTGILYFEGSVVFEYMKGTVRQQTRWEKNRLNAYLGSSMHFLRSAISNRLDTDGFQVMRLIRKPNPKYQNGSNDRYIQTLVTTPLTIFDFMKLTDKKGIFALGFDDCLYVLYKKKKATGSDNGKSKPPSALEYFSDPAATTVIFNTPLVFFDNNGIILNPRSILFDGHWGSSLIPGLLPVDYVPQP